METIVLFLVASACACAPVAFICLLFRDPPAPWWLVPALLLVMGVVIVLVGGVNLLGALAFPLLLAQILTVFIIAWGGWVLLALRRG
jgi:hypothetical protein